MSIIISIKTFLNEVLTMINEENKNTQNHNVDKENNRIDDKEFKIMLEQVAREDYAAFRALVNK